MTTGEDEISVQAWRPRDDLELLQDQLDGLASWRLDAHDELTIGEVAGSAREARQDMRRRMEVRRREQAALLARADEQLEESARLLRTSRPPRVVLVHRDAWFRGRVQQLLEAESIVTTAALDNGADGVGVVVAEQPDLVLVEDLLPMVTGMEVVRRVQAYAPKTLIAAHVAHADEVEEFLRAGARAAFTRQTPLVAVARELASLLRT